MNDLYETFIFINKNVSLIVSFLSFPWTDSLKRQNNLMIPSLSDIKSWYLEDSMNIIDIFTIWQK